MIQEYKNKENNIRIYKLRISISIPKGMYVCEGEVDTTALFVIRIRIRKVKVIIKSNNKNKRCSVVWLGLLWFGLAGNKKV